MKKGLSAVIGGLVGASASALLIGKECNKLIKQKSDKVDKFKNYYYMLNQWLILKQQGKALTKYFEENQFNNIAIYGVGEMGNRLYDELKDSDICVKFAIDKEDNRYMEVEVKSPEDDFEGVDVIVVTAIFAFEEINRKISPRVSCPVISLEDIIFDI